MKKKYLKTCVIHSGGYLCREFYKISNKTYMKKVFTFLAIACVMVACNNAADSTTAASDSVVANVDSTASAIVDSAKSAIDSTVAAAKDSVAAKVDSLKK
jgi:hypothetical protein